MEKVTLTLENYNKLKDLYDENKELKNGSKNKELEDNICNLKNIIRGKNTDIMMINNKLMHKTSEMLGSSSSNDELKNKIRLYKYIAWCFVPIPIIAFFVGYNI